MNRFGTRLGATLYWVLAALQVVVGIALLAAIIGICASLAAPERFAEIGRKVNDAPLDSAEAAPLLYALIALASAWLAFLLTKLRAILGTIKDGQPFSAANVGRLRAIAWVLLGGVATQLVLVLALSPRFQILGGRGDAVDFSGLFSALFALVLAEVFREGVRLREDAEGTI